jgi:uncharacterized membrane protein YcaP (DUF421 family)
MDWKTLLLGEEQWQFLGETALRTLVMFLVILLSLRLLGKRGITQLSVFELGVIIGLGSAAGDPMFYKDVGLLPSILVFVIVVLLYRLITTLINKSRHIEQFVEGVPTCIVKDGRFIVENFKREPIALDEVFAQLRLNQVSHLGQVQEAVIETNGEVSILFLPDEQVKWGLPLSPNLSKDPLVSITEEGHYACTYCGYAGLLPPAPSHACPVCGHQEWLKALNTKRIA